MYLPSVSMTSAGGSRIVYLKDALQFCRSLFTTSVRIERCALMFIILIRLSFDCASVCCVCYVCCVWELDWLKYIITYC